MSHNHLKGHNLLLKVVRGVKFHKIVIAAEMKSPRDTPRSIESRESLSSEEQFSSHSWARSHTRMARSLRSLLAIFLISTSKASEIARWPGSCGASR